MLLLEELLSSPHQMLVHSAVEASHKVAARDRLGGFEAGGFSFFLSTIVKVIDVKQTETGVLLRVQAEGRVAVKSLVQAQPYFRAVVVPLTDSVDLDTLQAPTWRDICGNVERLRSLMRDVQNLSNKFKGPETSNLQRAMQWVDNPQPLVFSSSSLMLNSRPASGAPPDGLRTPPTGSFASGSYDSDDFQPSKILANQIQPDVDPIFTESISGSVSDSESDAQYAAAASTGAAGATAAASGAASTSGSGSGSGGSGSGSGSGSGTSGPAAGLPGAAAGSRGGSGGGGTSGSGSGGGGGGAGGLGFSTSSGLAAAAVLGDGSALGPGGVIRSRPSLLDLERACRLSMAAIQVLPRTTEEERAAVRAAQTAALETQDVLERLHLANKVMGEARGLLSAKCALLTLSASSSSSS
ncbi:hypothetical protein HYH02_003776 [Chlamydomonas schloesseri]|uniref:Uncharacterized protein n=1 Tax=Chlamydomonas schloesseri TaxID=2026947 RepID=A0A835WNP4_9CHLO|nr:hypothetical protein HYH02_003776 [Chlamydomonas schloesseri]|eukprot:KAG2451169.1 hypothetical protein HYH02_003776 [Chlamydomonas schloesseri]